MRDIDLITLEELEKIRQIWVVEKHEIEDRLPAVYEEATGERYPGRLIDDNLVMGQEVSLLRNLCGDDELHFQLVRELISIERQHRSMLRRAGLFKAFEQAFRRSFYDDEDDALARARQRRDALEDALQGAAKRTAPEVHDTPIVFGTVESE